MKIDCEFLALQLEYSRWASERSIHAARALTDEELSRDLGNSHGGVFGTLIHLFLSERVWLSRLQGRPRFTFADDGEAWTMDTLGPAWTSVAEDYRKWAANLKDAEAILDYVNLAGKPSSLPIWQVILHVVNHATYHRGQITTMLRQLGHMPVATDLHVFYMGRT